MTSSESRWSLMKPRAITVDGDRVVYRTAGKGPVLLLVHGMAGSSVTWRRVMPALAKRFTVLAPDLLGQGLSDKPRSEYSLGAYANTLRDVMDTLGHKRATVVGQSLGGGVAMQFAYQFPERCERLVLVDSGGLGREVTFYLRMLSVPGFESVFPLFCTRRLRDAGNLVGTWIGRAGVQSTPASQEIWRSYASLADAENRRAFFRSLHDVIDFSGQAVSALGRLYRAARLPIDRVGGTRPVPSGAPCRRGTQGHSRQSPRNLRRGGPLSALRGSRTLRRGARRFHRLHQARPPVSAVRRTTRRTLQEAWCFQGFGQLTARSVSFRTGRIRGLVPPPSAVNSRAHGDPRRVEIAEQCATGCKQRLAKAALALDRVLVERGDEDDRGLVERALRLALTA